MTTTKGADTRARVLDKALALINQKGFRDTSMQDIIDATGVKKGNLYFHFSSKDELGLSILREAAEWYFNYLAMSMRSRDPLGRIGDVIDAVLKYHRGKKLVGGCIFGNTALEMSDTGEAHAALVREIFTRWERMLSGLLAEAHSEGSLPAGLEPEATARRIIASLEGSIMMARLFKNDAHLAECAVNLKELLGVSIGHNRPW
jgi:TetR/AcrR family transcriptional regulator, transcriptional repressor for nem operon